MTKIVLGDGAKLDLEVLVETRMLIQANSGGGKSWAIRRLLEQSFGHVQHIVIDPEGEFASLREKFDYVLAAPAGGDTVAAPRYAKLLAHRLLELHASAIVDIYELQPHERIKFVRLFLEAMVNAPKSLWHPVLVVLDEAHNYCPQNGQAESASAVVGLGQRGRKRGYCLVPATQRLAKLHKDAAAECNNKLIGRSALDVDMKRAAEELGFTSKDQQQELRKLAAGDFFAFGPALTYEVERVRIGPVQTTHPKAGGRHELVPPQPTAKIKALLPKLADLPAEAEQEARDVEALRRDNTELRRKLSQAEKNAASACGHEDQLRAAEDARRELDAEVRELEARVHPLYEQGQRFKQYLADVASGLRSVAENLDGEIRNLELGDEVDAVVRGISRPEPKVVFNRKTIAAREATKKPAARPVPVSTNGHSPSVGLTTAQMRILRAVRQFEPLGIEELDKVVVAAMAGVPHTSGGYKNNLGALRSSGHIVYPQPGSVALTDEGRNAAGDVAAIEDLVELHRAWEQILTPAQWRIAQAVIERYPRDVGKEELAVEVDVPPTSGGYKNNLGRLRTLGVINYPSPGRVVATARLFPPELAEA